MVDGPLLLLWDIDGTLLQRASAEHAQALYRALHEIHGELDLDAARGVEAAGRTDGAIARDILLACGVPVERIDAEVETVARACAHAYEDLCPPDLSGRLAPGIADLLPEVAAQSDRYRFSLVTGNFEPVARLKLERAGIGAHFPAGQGAFGTDAEEREALPPLARERAAKAWWRSREAGGAALRAVTAWPRERTVVIGDTPRDIACAHADGLRVIAVPTGPFPAEALREADAVALSAAELRPLLIAWSDPKG